MQDGSERKGMGKEMNLMEKINQDLYRDSGTLFVISKCNIFVGGEKPHLVGFIDMLSTLMEAGCKPIIWIIGESGLDINVEEDRKSYLNIMSLRTRFCFINECYDTVKIWHWINNNGKVIVTSDFQLDDNDDGNGNYIVGMTENGPKAYLYDGQGVASEFPISAAANDWLKRMMATKGYSIEEFIGRY